MSVFAFDGDIPFARCGWCARPVEKRGLVLWRRDTEAEENHELVPARPLHRGECADAYIIRERLRASNMGKPYIYSTMSVREYLMRLLGVWQTDEKHSELAGTMGMAFEAIRARREKETTNGNV